MAETLSPIRTDTIDQQHTSPEQAIMVATDQRRITVAEIAEITGISPEEAEQMSIDAQFFALMFHQYCEWPAGREGDKNYKVSIEETRKIVTEEDENGRSILDKNPDLKLVGGGESVLVDVNGRSLSVLYRPYRGFKPVDNVIRSATPGELAHLCPLDAIKQDEAQKAIRFGIEESIAGLEGVAVDDAKEFLKELGVSDVNKLDLDIMINPFMIFDFHVTAGASEHQEQKSKTIMFQLLNMSRRLGMNGIFNPRDFNASMKNHAHGQLMPKRMPIFEQIEDTWTDPKQAYEAIDLGLGYDQDEVRVFVPDEGELFVTPVVISGKNIFQVMRTYTEAQKRLYGQEEEKASIVYEYNQSTGEYTIAMIPREKAFPNQNEEAADHEVEIVFEENGETITEKHVVKCGFASAEEGGEIVANKRNDLEDPDHDFKLLLDPVRGPKIIEAIYRQVNEKRSEFMKRLVRATDNPQNPSRV